MWIADSVKPESVVQVLDMLESAGLHVTLDGGWGVDALLGRITRAHEDLDLVVPLHECEQVIALLGRSGCRIEEDEPGRVVMAHADLGRIDLHTVTFDALGNAVQVQPAASPVVYAHHGFVEGSILGVPVPCISVEVQVSSRLGYERTEKHRRDVVALCEAFRLEVPSEWGEA